jgi:hypothetical protein
MTRWVTNVILGGKTDVGSSSDNDRDSDMPEARTSRERGQRVVTMQRCATALKKLTISSITVRPHYTSCLSRQFG